MDLPDTQALDDEDFAPTQRCESNDADENIQVAMLETKKATFSIYSGTTTIGRLPTCSIVIDEETVSKRHAEIEAESSDRAIFIRDLNSCNKTKINDSKLKPHALYQIKNGDKLTFGQVTATFKIYQTNEDSLISNNLQESNKKLGIIPGTPDSSMNISTVSESDISEIPGTQANESSFQRAKVPMLSSTNYQHSSPKVPTFSMDDLPSPLPKNKSGHGITEVEIQSFSAGDTKEITDNSIQNAQTYKSSAAINTIDDDIEEDIFDMETQRPSFEDEEKEDLENLPTQHYEVKLSDSMKRMSSDLSIYTAETQQVENIESTDESSKRKSIDISIYSAATQKATSEAESCTDPSENVETQAYCVEKTDFNEIKCAESSIYSAQTQKIVPDVQVNESLENIQTQSFVREEMHTFATPNIPKRKSTIKNKSQSTPKASIPCNVNDQSLENMETQCYEEFISEKSAEETMETFETQQFTPNKSTKKVRESIHEIETQIFESNKSNQQTPVSNKKQFSPNESVKFIDENIEDLETQKVEIRKSIGQTPVSGKKLNQSNLQKSIIDQSMDEVETQQFSPRKSVKLAEKSIDDLETQEIENSKSDHATHQSNIIIDDSTNEVETQEFIPNKSVNFTDENIEDLETLKNDTRKSIRQTSVFDKKLNQSTNLRKSIIDQSMDEVETQEFTPNKSVNFTDENIEDLETQKVETRRSIRQTPASSKEYNQSIIDQSTHEVETEQFSRNKSLKLTDENIEDLETQKVETRKSIRQTPITGKKLNQPTNLRKSIIDQSMDEVETQQFSPRKSVKLAEKSIDDLETQEIENSKSDHVTHQSNIIIDDSTNEAETQEFTPNKSVKVTDENIEDLETQKVQIRRSIRQTSASNKICNQSTNLQQSIVDQSIHEVETQEFTPNKSVKLVDVNIENLETQKVETSESIGQTPVINKIQSRSTKSGQPSSICSEKLADQSMDDLETQCFETIKSIFQTPVSIKKSNRMSTKNSEEEFVHASRVSLIGSKSDLEPSMREELSVDSGICSIDDKKSNLSDKNSNSNSLQEKVIIPTELENDKLIVKDDCNKASNLENDKHDNISENDLDHSVSVKEFDISKKINDNELEKTMEENDEEDVFYSQNLIEECPFAFLPDESQVDENSPSTDNNDLEVSEEKKLTKDVNDSIFSTSANNCNENANDQQNKSLQKQNQSNIIDDSSETDEEGIFSNFTPINNDTGMSKKDEDGSETDEEGVFSNHLSMEVKIDEKTDACIVEKNKKLSRNKGSSSETDEEGVFSSHLSKESENKQSIAESDKSHSRKSTDKLSDSETDEEGIFSLHFSRGTETEKSTIEDDINKSKKSHIKSSDSETDEEGIFSGHLSKENINETFNNAGKSKLEAIEKSAMSDLEEDIFDDDEKEKSISKQSEKSFTATSPKNDSTSKVGKINLNNINNSKTDSSIQKDAEIDDLAPTQIIEDKVNETEDMSLALTQKIDVDDCAPTQIVYSCTSQTVNKNIDSDFLATQIATEEKNAANKSTDEFDDFNLALTQKINTPLSKSVSYSKARRSQDISVDVEDNCEAPTQLLNTENIETTCTNVEDHCEAATQLLPQKRNLASKSMEEYDDDFQLAETQKMTNVEYTDMLKPTQIIESNLKNTNNEIFIQNKLTTAVVQKGSKVILSSSKRNLEEIDITSNKKVKITSDISANLDLNSTVEQNLDQLFDGAEMKLVQEESQLLTQQLENILESSQVEENSTLNVSVSKPSPTLGSRRNRRKPIQNSPLAKNSKTTRKSMNLNDTVEKNLNELFEENVNTVEEACESDSMMTQQLKMILCSQDDGQVDFEDNNLKNKCLSKSADTRQRRNVSLSTSTCRSKNEEHIDKSFNQQSTLDKSNTAVLKSAVDDNESITSLADNDNESQDNYFSNLKFKRKSNVIINSQEEDAPMDADQEIQSQDVDEYFSNLKSKRKSNVITDSQSSQEDETTLERSLSNVSRGSSKKRFNLSLSKSVNLNSSMSSLLGDQESESRSISTQERSILDASPSSRSTTSSSQQSQSSRKSISRKSSIATSVAPGSAKRVRARATIGFSNDLEPVESEELVSAMSTESESEYRQQQQRQSSGKQVCSQSSSTLACKGNRDGNDDNERVTASQKSLNESLNVDELGKSYDSDEDFLKNMPEIKVAGTVDCPPTNSQLAAPSDDEDLESISSAEVEIPTKWQWYAQKRYDLIYKKIDQTDNKPEPMKNVKEAPPDEVQPSSSSKKQSIDEILAQLQPNKKRQASRSPNVTRGNEAGSSPTLITRRGRSSKRARLHSNSPQLCIERIRRSSNVAKNDKVESDRNEEATSEQEEDVIKNSESESSDLDEPTIIPKYKPLAALKLDLATALAGDSDEEFEELRNNCARLLALKSAYEKPADSPDERRRESRSSPIIRQRKSKRTSTGTSRSSSSSSSSRNSCERGIVAATEQIKRRQRRELPGIADKDGVVFQVPSEVTRSPRPRATTPTTTTRTTKTTPKTQKTSPRMSGLAIVRNSKRSSGAAAEEDEAAHENYPPKRAKSSTTTVAAAVVQECRPRLQELSVLISPLREKFLSNHVDKRSGWRADDAYAKSNVKQLAAALSPTTEKQTKAPKSVDNHALLDKQSSENMPIEKASKAKSKKTTVATRRGGRRAADVCSDHSSKENIVDLVEEVVQQTRTTRRANGKITERDEVSNTDADKEEAQRAKKSTAVAQKKSEKSAQAKPVEEPKKMASILVLESDSDDSEFAISKETKNTRVQNTKNVSANEPNRVESTVSLTTRSRRAKKDSQAEKLDSEQLEKSNVPKNTSTRSRNVKKSNSSKSNDLESEVDKISKTELEDIEKDSKEKSNSEQAQKSEVVTVRSTRVRTAKNSALSKSKTSKSTENAGTTNKQVKTVENSDLHKLEKSKTTNTKVTTNSRNLRIRKDITSEKTEDSIGSRTRGRRELKPNKRYSNSVMLTEISDYEEEENLPIKKETKTSRSTRQTRKRAAVNEEAMDVEEIPSSVESQEVAIITTDAEKNKSSNSKTRKGRATRKSYSTYEITDYFEPAATRSKRAKLDKSEKSESILHEKNTKEDSGKVVPTSRRKNTPSPKPSASSTVPQRTTRSKKALPSLHQVMFTGDRSEIHRDIVKKLGGCETEDLDKCTILVTDKVRTTYKFLCSLARGTPIVSYKWLDDSNKAKSFLDYKNYILKDPESEKIYKFKLTDSLEKAKNKKFLKGYTIVLTPHTQPSTSELKELINSSGGNVLLEPPAKWSNKDHIIIVNKENLKTAKEFKAKAPRLVKIHSTEFILVGILRQEVNFQEFKFKI